MSYKRCSKCDGLFCDVLRSLQPNSLIDDIFIEGTDNNSLNGGRLLSLDSDTCLATFSNPTITDDSIFIVSCNKIIGIEVSPPTP
ncbi:hypothetical protein J2Z23_000018 [Lederbergia galactosidilyticus]|uniref:hypothetical protein n=1 Tax=Lederbergia galactosidilytica TaxID=217031 RepID=UPI001AE84BF8|nr:hypothetical protein [Lederbergia galactosidilytica]MBP1913086.1 hypothetical protein [Lederbergia galactosidilytica]